MGSVIVMILGSFLLYAGVMNIAARAAMGLSVEGAGVFLVGLGIFIIWLGARRRQNWPIPLGITWIVLGFLMCVAVPTLKQAAVRRGDLQMSQGANGILTAGISFVVLGCLFILARISGGRREKLDMQDFVRHSQRGSRKEESAPIPRQGALGEPSAADAAVERLVLSIFADDVFPDDDTAAKRQKLVDLGDRAVPTLARALDNRGLSPLGIIRALKSIGTELAAHALGLALMVPDDNTTRTLEMYEEAVEALVEINSDAARLELERARSGPAARYVNAIVKNEK